MTQRHNEESTKLRSRLAGAKIGVVSVDVAEIEAILARIEPAIAKEDHDKLTSVLRTLVEVTRLVRKRGATIARLRRMLGQTSTEKTANVVAASAEAVATGAASEGAAPARDDGESPSTAGEPPSTTSAEPANDTSAAEKPRRKGHGRIPGTAYATKPIAVPHETLHVGKECPGCAHGKLYGLEPSTTTRIFGQAPLISLQWDCDRLRCGGCGSVFTARLPEEGRGPKYSEDAASMMALLRYGMGVPLNRLAAIQRLFGVPLPASTQWEVVRDRLPDLWPVYDELVALAANGQVLHNDDTYVKILELMGKRRVKLVAAGELDVPDRTGLFTTAIVAKTAAGPVALFSSGRQHAGENLADLLDKRDPTLPPPIQMCDGLDRNLATGHSVVLSNCLAHARRHVVDEVGNHPELCAHLLEEVGKVFANEAACRKNGLSGEERLAFHQRESKPIMDSLPAWMTNLLETKRVEPNSGLGGAFTYLLKRWDALTLFLRVRDAPLDNNMSERSLKRAIRHRRTSLFYRSCRGALVGDVYMALIYTTELHGGDPFRYLSALMTHDKDVATRPAEWLPWNYQRALERLAEPPAAAA